jgi:hypothetical protein
MIYKYRCIYCALPHLGIPTALAALPTANSMCCPPDNVHVMSQGTPNEHHREALLNIMSVRLAVQESGTTKPLPSVVLATRQLVKKLSVLSP